MTRTVNRRFVYYRDYFRVFHSNLDTRSREKVNQVLYTVQHIEIIPVQYLKPIRGSKGLYEIRIKLMNHSVRIMCVIDRYDHIILLNLFHQKDKKNTT